MNNTTIRIFLVASIIVIAYLVFQPLEKKEYSQKEMQNISNAFEKKFTPTQKKQQMSPNTPSGSPHPSMQTSDKITAGQQSIIGVIYKQPQATWFIKAKDSTDKINTISGDFKNYFIDQLKFDGNHQPIFSHLPDSMKAKNTSSMRVATFKIGDVEISVSRLAGQQDVFANVKRWMGQIGLKDNDPIHLEFKDDKKTIIVKMPR